MLILIKDEDDFVIHVGAGATSLSVGAFQTTSAPLQTHTHWEGGGVGTQNKTHPCGPTPILPCYLVCQKKNTMSQYIAWKMQYSKNTRMVEYIWSHFAVFSIYIHDDGMLFVCSAQQSSAHQKIRHIKWAFKKSRVGTTGVLIGEIPFSTSRSYAYYEQHYVLCKGSCSTYCK